MSEFIVRAYEPADEEQFYRVWQMTYHDGVPYAAEDRNFWGTVPYVCERDGAVAAVAGVRPMTVTRGAGKMRCAGVAGVAVSPECRGSGAGSALMRGLVRLLREEGYVLSALYAYREPFYRKSGYEVCGKRLHLSCPAHRFPAVESELPARVISQADWKALAQVDAAFCHARSGANLLDETWAKRRLGDEGKTTLYAFGDPPEAYAAVDLKTAFWTEQAVDDFEWSTERGYRSILALMRQVAANKTSLTWFEPSDSPYVSSYLDQGVSVEVTKPVMYRVLNVPEALRALRALRPERSGSFRFRVVDSDFPENEGPFAVEFSADRISVGEAAEADFCLDVKRFAQAYLGDPSLADLARNGLISLPAGEARWAAEALMTAMPVYCQDFF